MRKILFLLSCVGIAFLSLETSVGAAGNYPKTSVLVITGGHGFEKEPFYQMFKDNSDINFVAVQHTNAHKLLRPDSAKSFDVLVSYDMYQPISEETKQDLVKFVKSGKGFVVLHHAIASYQSWPEYREMIGAHYYLDPMMVDGVQKARSIYKHDVTFKVHVENQSHPITKGLSDFEIRDETYKLFDVFPGSTILLTTDEPTSNRELAWTRPYGKGRVVFIQGGHDHYAYENPSFRKLLAQAIQWAAGKK